MASYYTRENNEDVDLLNLLYLSLKATLKENLSNVLVRCIFELKSLQIEGEYPGVPQNTEILESTRYALSHIESAQLEKLYTFNVSDEVLNELCKITSLYRTMFIDRTVKSMEMIATFDDAL